MLAALAVVLSAVPQEPVDLSDRFDVPDGLRVTRFAESPQLYNPTAIDVDDRNRIWVAEGVNYRKGGGRNPGRVHPDGERIVILEDADGDGVAERVIVGAVDCGGSGTWRELVVLDRERAAVVQRAALDLGDRVEVHSLAFDGDRLVVGLRTHGSDDSMSAPTVPTLLVLRLVEGVLVPAGA